MGPDWGHMGSRSRIVGQGAGDQIEGRGRWGKWGPDRGVAGQMGGNQYTLRVQCGMRQH